MMNAKHIAHKMASGGAAPHGAPHPAAVIALGIKHGQDGEDGDTPEEGGEGLPEGLHQHAMDFVHAIHSGDAMAVAHAFHDMFQACESAPHEEGGDDTEDGYAMGGETHGGSAPPMRTSI